MRRVAMLLLALLPALPASGATFPELYTVAVAANPTASNPRADATGRAMSVLLTRVTGRRDAGAYPEMQELMRSADRYVSSYETVAGGIRVGFSRTAVNDALTARELPIWPAERPATLIWIAFDMGSGEYVELMADTGAQARRVGGLAGAPSFPLSPPARQRFDAHVAELLQTVDGRGLPVSLPALDAVDREAVRFADVWGGFDPFVVRAARRYGADAVLIGRVSETEFGTEARWTLLRGDRRQTRVTTDLRSAVDWLADEYAAQYVTVGGARLTWLTVRGITSYADYVRVGDYLRSVSLIEPDSINFEAWSRNGDLVVRVAARGDEYNLRQTLALDGRLVEPEVPEEPEDSPGIDRAATGSLVVVPAWLSESSGPGSR